MKQLIFLSALFSALLSLSLPSTAHAFEAPAGFTPVGSEDILRGSFVQEIQLSNTQRPSRSLGHFVIAPSHGLIWSIESLPLPSVIIATRNGVAQNFHGLTLQLPMNNRVHRIFDMVSAALAGNWQELENDYAITRSGTDDHWQMLLTPRPKEKQAMLYSVITVSGSKYVEHILLARTSGNNDAFTFNQTMLDTAPLQPQEVAAFNLVKH